MAKNQEDGLSLIEVMIAVAVVGVVIFSFMNVSKFAMSGSAAVAVRQQTMMLRSYVKNSLSCDKTFATAMEACDNGGYIDLKRSDDSVFITRPQHNDYTTVSGYALRANCQGNEVKIAFAKYSPQATPSDNVEKKFSKDPLTGKDMAWADLFNGVPLACPNVAAPAPEESEGCDFKKMSDNYPLSKAMDVSSLADLINYSWAPALRLTQDIDLSGLSSPLELNSIILLYGQNHKLYNFNGNFSLFGMYHGKMKIMDTNFSDINVESSTDPTAMFFVHTTLCVSMENIAISHSSVKSNRSAAIIGSYSTGVYNFLNVAISDTTVTGTESAALVHDGGTGTYDLTNLAINNATVSGEDAGLIAGGNGTGSHSIKNMSVNNATVNGKNAGMIIGSGTGLYRITDLSILNSKVIATASGGKISGRSNADIDVQANAMDVTVNGDANGPLGGGTHGPYGGGTIPKYEGP